ncbi:hypothetical protein AB4090_00620 [Acidithiobacillus sp. IBUN Pt1247-S3]
MNALIVTAGIQYQQALHAHGDRSHCGRGNAATAGLAGALWTHYGRLATTSPASCAGFFCGRAVTVTDAS